jgi:N6-adenosine-specific RNA methylase IME4
VFTGTDRQALDFVNAENLERRDLTDKQRAMIAAKVATLRLGDNQHTRSPAPIGAVSLFEDASAAPDEAAQPLMSQSEAAEAYSSPRRSVQRAVVIEANATPELKAAVATGPVSLDTGALLARLPAEEQQKIVAMSEKDILSEAKRIRKEQNDARRAERMEKLRTQSAGNTPLSTLQKFPVIYMDPPTKFAAGDSDRSTENHYQTMTEEEIAALPVSDLALADAVLFIWTTVPWLRKTIRLLEGWGFEYVSEYAWDKVNASLGFWNRNRHESLLVATRGNMPAPDPSLLEDSLLTEKRGEHSAKPVFFRDMITRYYPDMPKVELFPRGELPVSWRGWGNEARLTAQQSLGIDTASPGEAGSEEAA